MKSKLVAQNGGERTFVLILDPGDEAFTRISKFAETERLSAASLTALGAFSNATVGWFDLAAKSYRKIPVDQQCEVLSAIGDGLVGVQHQGEAELLAGDPGDSQWIAAALPFRLGRARRLPGMGDGLRIVLKDHDAGDHRRLCLPRQAPA